MNDELILVGLDDKVIGKGEKMWVHRNDKLHRAFSVFLVSGDKMLIQKRDMRKYHSGGLWANACCSHPRYGEDLEDAVGRRLREELGISAPVKEIFHFVYRASYEDGLTEFEYDHVFLGEFSGEVYPQEGEIESVRWVKMADLKRDVVDHPQNYAAWFLTALPRVLEWLERQGV